ncbi:MAG TPA: GTP pyrophosphokinase family protein [Candidatus Jeotgalibaca merdavium]|jgi:putative GTP pyrophosphokinase|uniref:GTP pyrophosphokinase family protein n=2 Tax=Jeotgalibaca TaxID=1470540 RepID=A0A6G7KBA3_9LACT|nr:GTP pyrophosphokinase family protein [Jeotgalibaca arthritidis]QII82548.1 GTP pyrophosphokinase family protein [Jeotgalibaca arthritidis]HJA89982.1 GTP pyrophosphokinase family protein [Candidatus Jeotgalibaca merdavium]
MENKFVTDWDSFLAPYEQAVEELKVKLKSIRKQYRDNQEHAPIEFITGRVKTKESILEKAEVRNIRLDRLEEDVQDIAGIRIMCQFVDDIHEVVKLLKARNDFKVIIERDYVTNRKESGYRSYHLVIEYPVQRIMEEKVILCEIQIRTLAMNFWATIEHTLNYKYKGEYPKELHNRLIRAAEAAFLLDNEMSEIREEIKEAQFYFSDKKKNIN